MSTTDKRVKEYQQLLRQTARQLGERHDSELVKHVTSFKVLRQNLLAKMLLGEAVDPAHLIKIDEVLAHYLPQGQPTRVEVEVIRRDRCRADLIAAGEVLGGPRPSDPPPPAAAIPAGPPVTAAGDAPNGESVPSVGEAKPEPPKPSREGDGQPPLRADGSRALEAHALFPSASRPACRNMVGNDGAPRTSMRDVLNPPMPYLQIDPRRGGQ